MYGVGYPVILALGAISAKAARPVSMANLINAALETTVVCTSKPSHLDFVFPKDRVALLKLLEAWRIVEVANVRFAATRASEDHLARLEDLVTRLEGGSPDEPRTRVRWRFDVAS